MLFSHVLPCRKTTQLFSHGDQGAKDYDAADRASPRSLQLICHDAAAGCVRVAGAGAEG